MVLSILGSRHSSGRNDGKNNKKAGKLNGCKDSNLLPGLELVPRSSRPRLSPSGEGIVYGSFLSTVQHGRDRLLLGFIIARPKICNCLRRGPYFGFLYQSTPRSNACQPPKRIGEPL